MREAEAYRVDLLVGWLYDSGGEPHGVAALATDVYEDLLVRLREDKLSKHDSSAKGAG